MTKQEILDFFKDINFMYNNASMHDTLSNMLDKLLENRPEIVRCKNCIHAAITVDGDFCKYCDLERDEDGFLREVYFPADYFCPYGEVKQDETDRCGCPVETDS